MRNPWGLRGVWIVTLLFFLALPLPVLLGCSGDSPSFPTEYQAVLLDNGQVVYGKLEKASPSYLTLREAFYVRTQVDQDKKQARNILVKRGLEWHAPDVMHINTRHVVLIEPVAPESQVAQLIRRFKKGPPPAAPPAQEEPVRPSPKAREPQAPAPKAAKDKTPPQAR